MTVPIVRLGARADAPAVARLLREVFAETYALAIPAAILDAYLAREFATSRVAADLAQPAAPYLLAQAGDQLACVSRVADGLPPAELGIDRAGELAKLYVGAAFRGQGVADRLLRASLERGWARGWRAIWLAVWQQNTRAVAFYERHGFSVCGHMSVFVDTIEFHDLVMLRGLPC